MNKVGYYSAGTVEYLYDPETEKYYFLELNPRLQVEHPCTEMVSRVNIPALQLMVAMGVPLFHIKEIQNLYGIASNGSDFLNDDTEIIFDSIIEKRAKPYGHVIATRITAENPDKNFQPTSGKLTELTFRRQWMILFLVVQMFGVIFQLILLEGCM